MDKKKCIKNLFKCAKCKKHFTRWSDAWRHGIFCKQGKVLYKIKFSLEKEVQMAMLDEQEKNER